mmetsp:Transcript_60070/g.169397  ORF Transcript_60070/g.169397 Transcript_60070/m.169397 type:complete len:243 (-) Transcript_60070:1058-1786(-)
MICCLPSEASLDITHSSLASCARCCSIRAPIIERFWSNMSIDPPPVPPSFLPGKFPMASSAFFCCLGEEGLGEFPSARLGDGGMAEDLLALWRVVAKPVGGMCRPLRFCGGDEDAEPVPSSTPSGAGRNSGGTTQTDVRSFGGWGAGPSIAVACPTTLGSTVTVSLRSSLVSGAHLLIPRASSTSLSMSMKRAWKSANEMSFSSVPNGFSNSFATSLMPQKPWKTMNERIGLANIDLVKTTI